VRRWVVTLILLSFLAGGVAARTNGTLDDRAFAYYAVGLAVCGIVVRFIEDYLDKNKPNK
jgi:hypothetical protein